ncbi:MAG: hypothetical protein MZW92_59595 [Comamonadaceae bacterium]|nr:hypothetical protein [Comamonadaceae bacterium]
MIFLIGDFTVDDRRPVGPQQHAPAADPRADRGQRARPTTSRRRWCSTRAQTEIRYNCEWSEPLGAARHDPAGRARTRVARMLERDDFARALRARRADRVHEFLYPLMQGYDSVALQGRPRTRRHRPEVQPAGRSSSCSADYGQEPQCILTMPLLEGLDGVEKMSKSQEQLHRHHRGRQHEMFGKVMSISDELMWRWYTLLSLQVREPRSRRLKARGATAGATRKDAKVALAKEITARFHSARRRPTLAEQDFINRSKGGVPDEMPEVAAVGCAALGIGALLKAAGLAPSTGEAQPPDRRRRRRASTPAWSATRGSSSAPASLCGAGRQAQVRPRHAATGAASARRDHFAPAASSIFTIALVAPRARQLQRRGARCGRSSFVLAPASSSAFSVAWWRAPPSPSTIASITAVQCRLLTWSSGAPAAISWRTTPSWPRCAAAISAVPS